MTSATLLLEQFDHLLTTPEAVEELNRAILTLAVQGKLVAQDPQDEPIEGLLKAIRIEVEQLVGTKQIYADESFSQPFHLPHNWAWAKLGEVCVVVMGQSPPSNSYNSLGDGLPFYQGKKDFGEMFPTPTQWCSEPSKIAQENDVLISVRAPVGPTNLCQEKSCIGRGLAAIRSVEGILPRYILYMMRAFQSQLAEKGSGTTFVAISGKDLYTFPVPIPPLAEQHGIVARVEALFAQTRQLAEKLTRAQRDLALLNQSALAHLLAASASTVRQAHGSAPEDFAAQWDFIAGHFESLFTEPEHIAPLRQTIMELAVRGKLTRRESTDEPASVLLERIQAEKAKVSNSEPLSPVKEGDRPFELPEGWGFIQLGDLARFIDYRGHTPVKTETGLRLITAKNVRMGHLNLEPREYVDPAIYDKWMTRGIPKKGDLLFTTEAPMGNVALLDTDEKALFAQRLITLRMYGGVNSKFVMYALMSQPLQSQILAKSSGVTARGIKAKLFKTVLMIIPPLAEQQRIVAKVQQLLGLCDALETKLWSAREERVRLTAAVLAGVGGAAAYAGN